MYWTEYILLNSYYTLKTTFFKHFLVMQKTSSTFVLTLVNLLRSQRGIFTTQ
jgi:hypothetical protein